MNWLNLETWILHAPEYIGSDPTARSTWLNVCLWCSQQENGGRIEGAAEWKDRQWQQTCGVTGREIRRAGRLLRFDGSALVVWNYPVQKEAIVKEKRASGARGGVKSGEARAKHMLEANAEAYASTEGKGKEEEGKGKENTPYSPPLGDVAVEQPNLILDVPPAEPPPPTKEPIQLRIEKLFGRQVTTPLNPKEQKYWAKNRAVIASTSNADVELLEWFYAQPQERTYARKDLGTLINNWNAELDRARAYKKTDNGLNGAIMR